MKELGQLYLVGFDGQEYNSELDTLLEQYQVGSIILFERNIPDTRDKLKQLIQDINDKADAISMPRPIIALDHEGGRVHRLRDLATLFPYPGLTSSLPDSDITEIAYQQAQELLYFGFNMIMAPVLDLCSPDAPGVIGARSFNPSPEAAARRAYLAIEGFNKAGIISVPKHFPGHGVASVDPHFDMVTIDKSLEAFEQHDLIPFKSVISKGAQIIMTAHVITSCVDKDWPATLSSIWIDYLRNKLGFEGVIMADDLCMKAIWDNYTVEEVTSHALNAGVDQLIICHNSGEFEGALERTFNQHIKLMSDSQACEHKLQVSLGRMERLKAPLSNLTHPTDESIFDHGQNLLERISADL